LVEAAATFLAPPANPAEVAEFGRCTNCGAYARKLHKISIAHMAKLSEAITEHGFY
jgi:hypothetical protein